MNKFDPRSKLMLVISISSLAVYVKDLFLLTLITLLGILVAKVLQANLFKAFRKLKGLFIMIFFVAVLQSIFNHEGRILFEIFDITLITTAGLYKGAEFILRMTIILTSATIITTSSSREMIQGLVQLKVPYEIAFLVSLGIRFLPMLTEQIKDSFTALKLRGVIFKELSLKKKLTVFSYLFLPVIASTIKKAEKIALSMETKGFRARENRTSILILKLSNRDIFLMAFSALILFIFVYAQTKFV
ncbi:MAG: energy-coupling factor transporter transmembrane component T [Candidatus Delongbacteria bacterium]|jgi:energy-coupling factor transport system permease protein|nr:energy-coupling factor transporter transmembrane component T [Candidatus Delongbacteria bacterium]